MVVAEAMQESGFDFTEIIHGGARGVDQIAGLIGKESGLPVHVFPANWDEYPKSAGFLRNMEMVAEADAVVAVWDGKSRGTKHTINHAKKVGVPVYVYQSR